MKQLFKKNLKKLNNMVISPTDTVLQKKEIVSNIERIDKQYSLLRSKFFKIQREGIWWGFEFLYRFLFNLGKDLDRMVGWLIFGKDHLEKNQSFSWAWCCFCLCLQESKKETKEC